MDARYCSLCGKLKSKKELDVTVEGDIPTVCAHCWKNDPALKDLGKSGMSNFPEHEDVIIYK